MDLYEKVKTKDLRKKHVFNIPYINQQPSLRSLKISKTQTNKCVYGPPLLKTHWIKNFHKKNTFKELVKNGYRQQNEDNNFALMNEL